jgi:hypothetical protein
METVTVSNWSSLLEEIFRDMWNPDIHRYRSPYVFRGAGTRDVVLVPGLARLAGSGDDAGRFERNLIRNFRKYASAELPAPGSDWRSLPFAQHHGLPTRLLDWSFSPLIAAHFATENSDFYDRDGVVWCINHQFSSQFLPDVLKRELQDEYADVFTAEILERVAPGLADLGRLTEEAFLLFLEPPSLDTRITNQFALFSLMSTPGASLPAWLEQHPEAAREIVIPAAAKHEIRDKLDQAGITERIIYPGADGIARWLRRYYRPAPKPE